MPAQDEKKKNIVVLDDFYVFQGQEYGPGKHEIKDDADFAMFKEGIERNKTRLEELADLDRQLYPQHATTSEIGSGVTLDQIKDLVSQSVEEKTRDLREKNQELEAEIARLKELNSDDEEDEDEDDDEEEEDSNDSSNPNPNSDKPKDKPKNTNSGAS